MREVVPRAIRTEPGGKKVKMIVALIVETDPVGAEASWRVRCDLKAGESNDGSAVGKKGAHGEGCSKN